MCLPIYFQTNNGNASCHRHIQLVDLPLLALSGDVATSHSVSPEKNTLAIQVCCGSSLCKFRIWKSCHVGKRESNGLCLFLKQKFPLRQSAHLYYFSYAPVQWIFLNMNFSFQPSELRRGCLWCKLGAVSLWTKKPCISEVNPNSGFPHVSFKIHKTKFLKSHPDSCTSVHKGVLHMSKSGTRVCVSRLHQRLERALFFFILTKVLHARDHRNKICEFFFKMNLPYGITHCADVETWMKMYLSFKKEIKPFLR